MKKFFIRFAILLVFLLLIEAVFGTYLDMLKSTPVGFAIDLTAFLALGWYWSDICDYVEEKFKAAKKVD